MSVTLTRAYGGFASGATVTFPDSTESALIAQGLATAVTTPATSFPAIYHGGYGALTEGGNVQWVPNSGVGSPTYLQCPSVVSVIPLNVAALTGYETNGVAQTAGDFNVAEIYCPGTNTWKGAGVLNGTTVGTNKWIVALWGSNGALIANSAVAGTTSSGASTVQNVDFTAAVTLPPGRYFVGVQADGNTDTIRHVLSANGSTVMTKKLTSGTFGTVPATMTVPTTFTTALAPIMTLYTY